MKKILFSHYAIVLAVLALCLTGCLEVKNSTVGSPIHVSPSSQPLPGCGIDSKELRVAADKMARLIINSDIVNNTGGKPRIVIDSEYFSNDSSYVIDRALFTDYLRVELQRASNGKFEILGRNYSKMVEQERDAQAKGNVTTGAVVEDIPKRLGWDYRLGGSIRSLSKVVSNTGQASSYFLITFELIERGSGRIVLSDNYEFKKVSSISSIYR